MRSRSSGGSAMQWKTERPLPDNAGTLPFLNVHFPVAL
jgi:hypothetical protein